MTNKPDRIPYSVWSAADYKQFIHEYGAIHMGGVYYVLEPGSNDLVKESVLAQKDPNEGLVK